MNVTQALQTILCAGVSHLVVRERERIGTRRHRRPVQRPKVAALPPKEAPTPPGGER